MTLNCSLRNWHTWLGVTLSLPVIVVGLTAILMAHGQELGFRNIQHQLRWLPGYQQETNPQIKMSDLEIRATLTTHDGRYLLGTRYGLYQLKNEQLSPVEGLSAVDIRSIRETSNGLILASRNGVWRSIGSQWKKIYKGDAWEVEVQPNQTIRIATRAKGLLETVDNGKHWKPLHALNTMPAVLNAKAQAEEMNLGKLVFDLHTGRALLGKDSAWIWIDLIGFSLILSVLSGLFLWRETRKQQALLQGK
jgi:hypothetical protein